MMKQESLSLLTDNCPADYCSASARGAAGEESPADRIPNMLPPLPLNPARIEAFRQGLRELGYVEGKNIVIEYRYAEGKHDRLPVLAAELVRLKVDVIVTSGASATRAAKEATDYDSHCHDAGSRSCWKRVRRQPCAPGGNITGLSTLAPEMSGKRLELLKEIVPKLSRVAVFGTSTSPGNAQVVKRSGTRRKGVRSEASIPRRSKSQGY